MPPGVRTRLKDGNKKQGKDDKDKKKEDDSVEHWWPPFVFDGRQALKSKLCLNLRFCQYDIFKQIAIEDFGWRVVDWRNKVVDKDVL